MTVKMLIIAGILVIASVIGIIALVLKIWEKE